MLFLFALSLTIAMYALTKQPLCHTQNMQGHMSLEALGNFSQSFFAVARHGY